MKSRRFITLFCLLLGFIIMACDDEDPAPALKVVEGLALQTSTSAYTFVQDTNNPNQFIVQIPWVYTNLTDTTMQFNVDRCPDIGMALYKQVDGAWLTMKSDHWVNQECITYPNQGNFITTLESGASYADTVTYIFGTLSDRWKEKEGTYRLEILKGELLPSSLWEVDSMKFSNSFEMN